MPSKQIGDAVLDALADRNEVAYVRFASVYYDFKTLDEFEKILAQQRGEKGLRYARCCCVQNRERSCSRSV